MKRNPKVALAIIALLVAGVAWAGGEKGKYDPAAMAAKYQEKLGLTDEQTQQVQALIVDIHSRWEEIKASEQDEAARKESKKQLKSEFHTRLKSILTEEQLARYEEWQAEYARKKQAQK